MPAGNERSLSKDFNITMLTFPGGIERTASEFASLKQSGFALAGITPTASMIGVVDGRPA